jgi:hypothetical protein
VLLARADQPVSRSELTELLWDGGPPASALNVIALRRILEPDLSARARGSFLHVAPLLDADIRAWSGGYGISASLVRVAAHVYNDHDDVRGL